MIHYWHHPHPPISTRASTRGRRNRCHWYCRRLRLTLLPLGTKASMPRKPQRCCRLRHWHHCWMAKSCKIDRRILKFYWNFAYGNTSIFYMWRYMPNIASHIMSTLRPRGENWQDLQKIYDKIPIFCTIWLPNAGKSPRSPPWGRAIACMVMNEDLVDCLVVV